MRNVSKWNQGYFIAAPEHEPDRIVLRDRITIKGEGAFVMPPFLGILPDGTYRYWLEWDGPEVTGRFEVRS